MPSTTPRAMRGSSFLAPPPSATMYQDGDVYYLVFSSRSRMYILLRTADELFTDLVDRTARARGLDVVINGNNHDVSLTGAVFTFLHMTAGEGSRIAPLSQLIQNQAYLAGVPKPQRFYAAQGRDPMHPFRFGFGDPPTAGSVAAIEGLGPLICGKTVIAHSSSADKVVVLHQPDGAATGIALDDLHRSLSALKSLSRG